MRRMSIQRGWMTEKEFVDSLVLSRLTPGISILAQVLLIGRAVCGVPGMIAGIVGLMAPSLAITLTLAWLYELISQWPAAQTPLHAVTGVAAGFAVALALQLMRDILTRHRLLLSTALFAGYVALALIIHDPLIVMGFSIAVALAFPGLFDIAETQAGEQDTDSSSDDEH
jgi:chromate transporter